MDILFYAIAVALLFLLMAGSVYLRKKLNIKNEDYEAMMLVLEVADYITSKIEFKYEQGVTKIIQYCFMAVELVDSIEEYADIEYKKNLVKDKALEICINEGLEIDTGSVEIVDKIVEYIFDNNRH